METPNFTPAKLSQMAMNKGYGPATYGDEEKMLVQFYYEPQYMSFESEKQGRPIYEQRLLVKLQAFGSRDSHVKEVDDQIKARFPKAWEAFSSGANKPMDGTPLEAWPPITIAQVAEFTHMNVHTVEQLADITDIAVQKLGMGATDLRKKARAWLAQAKDQTHLLKFVTEVDLLRKELAAKDEIVQELVQKVRDLEKAAKK